MMGKGRGLHWPSASMARATQPYQRALNKQVRDHSIAVVAQSVGKESPIERQLALQLQWMNLSFEREVKFHDTRRWRFDFANREKKLAVEVEGMVHRIKAQFESDIEKYAAALLQGWLVLRVSGKTIRDGRALLWIEQAYRARASQT